MRIDFLADTNFLIYLQEGKEFVMPFLAFDIGISFISEIELLWHKNLSFDDKTQLKSLLNDNFIINFDEQIKQQTIKLKQNYSIKLPDAVIAATAIYYKLPLITADKGFEKIK